jgi:hypothetical protein
MINVEKIDVLEYEYELKDIALSCYPKEWAYIPEGYTIGLFKSDVLIGYCVLDIQNRYISDIAVYPNQRIYSKILLISIFNVIKNTKGLWSANCRETTSYKFIKYMEERGKIEIHSEKVSNNKIGDDKLYYVVFSSK